MERETEERFINRERLRVARGKQQRIFREFVERELQSLETNRTLHKQYVMGIIQGHTHLVKQLDSLEHLLYRIIESSYSKKLRHAKYLMILYLEHKHIFISNIAQGRPNK